VRLCAALLLTALLAACGSAPRSTPPEAGATLSLDTTRDGPPAAPPPDLIDRPDPEPRVEAIRTGGPNKPYVVLGQAYTPLAADVPVVETGLASWYGRKFHGRPTANGETYDMYAMSAAHRTMPLPSFALVRNPANGREVVVRVNDRGPFHDGRIIDLSYAAALKLGVLRGVRPVEVRRLTHEDIRTGRWRTEAIPVLAAAPVDSPPLTPPPPSGPSPSPPATPSPAPLLVPVSWPVASSPAAPAPTTPLPTLPMPSAPTPTAPMALATAPLAALSSPPPATLAAPPTERDEALAVARATATAGPDTTGFWVQLGAFRQQQGAFALREQMTRELTWLEPWLAIFDDSTLYRLQAGPFASRREAQGAAERIRDAARLQPLVVQRP
jgi:rare lipoprotein A